MTGIVSHAADPAQDPWERAGGPAEVELDGRLIRYSGKLSREGNALVFQLFESAEDKPGALAIASRGGEVRAGMALGSWLFERGLDVEVSAYCLSSCANYVFPAGRRKRLGRSAVLAWHGGATQRLPQGEVASSARRMGDFIPGLIDEEAAFFRKLGVDPRLTVLGQDERYARYSRADGYVAWDYSIDDLAALGVGGIEVEGGGPWQPALPRVELKLYRVELSAHPEPSTTPH